MADDERAPTLIRDSLITGGIFNLRLSDTGSESVAPQLPPMLPQPRGVLRVPLPPDTKPFAVLEANAAKDALLLAIERFPQPKCHPETRKAAQGVVTNWLCRKGESKDKDIMWLSGGPGVGKSAIVQTVCEALAAKNDPVHAVHFFGRGQGDREKAFFLPATIAYQLCRTTYSRSSIEYVIQTDPDILRQTIEAQFRKLVTDTARGRWRYFQRPLTIVIDALDECDDAADQDTLLRLVFEGIATYKMRFLIVSRPEQNIHAFFRREDVARRTIHIRLDEETFNTSQDILTSLRAEFERIRQAKPELCPDLPTGEKWPGEVVILKLATMSDAQFIFPKLAIGYVETGVSPNQQLHLLLKTLCPGAFSKLDLLYHQILSRPPTGFTANSPEFEHYQITVKVILEVVLTWPRNLSAAGIAKVLDLEVDVVQGVIRGPLRTLFKFKEDDPTSEITFIHKSLRDFLLDPKRSRSFFIPSDQPDAIYLSKLSRQPIEDRAVFMGIMGVLVGQSTRWCPFTTLAFLLNVELDVVCRVALGSLRPLFNVDGQNEWIIFFDDPFEAFLSDQSRSGQFYVPRGRQDDLFLRILSHQQLASVEREFLKEILGVVVAWPPGTCTVDRIADVLDVDSEIVRNAICRPMRALFDMTMVPYLVSFFNNSFKPFLLDRERSGEFHIASDNPDTLFLKLLSRQPSHSRHLLKTILQTVAGGTGIWGLPTIRRIASKSGVDPDVIRNVVTAPGVRALLEVLPRGSLVFFDKQVFTQFLSDPNRSGPFHCAVRSRAGTHLNFLDIMHRPTKRLEKTEGGERRIRIPIVQSRKEPNV